MMPLALRENPEPSGDRETVRRRVRGDRHSPLASFFEKKQLVMVREYAEVTRPATLSSAI